MYHNAVVVPLFGSNTRQCSELLHGVFLNCTHPFLRKMLLCMASSSFTFIETRESSLMVQSRMLSVVCTACRFGRGTLHGCVRGLMHLPGTQQRYRRTSILWTPLASFSQLTVRLLLPPLAGNGLLQHSERVQVAWVRTPAAAAALLLASLVYPLLGPMGIVMGLGLIDIREQGKKS